MRILFISDIVGSPGRRIVVDRVADLIEQERLDLVVANGENSASGFGITPRIAEELLGAGVGVLPAGTTSGTARRLSSSSRTSRVCCARLTFPRAVPAAAPIRPSRAMVCPTPCSACRVACSWPRTIVHFAPRIVNSRSCLPKPKCDRRGHPRRNHQRKAGHGLVPRRPRFGGPRHPHPRRDRGRAASSQVARLLLPTSV